MKVILEVLVVIALMFVVYLPKSDAGHKHKTYSKTVTIYEGAPVQPVESYVQVAPAAPMSYSYSYVPMAPMATVSAAPVVRSYSYQRTRSSARYRRGPATSYYVSSAPRSSCPGGSCPGYVSSHRVYSSSAVSAPVARSRTVTKQKTVHRSD